MTTPYLEAYHNVASAACRGVHEIDSFVPGDHLRHGHLPKDGEIGPSAFFLVSDCCLAEIVPMPKMRLGWYAGVCSSQEFPGTTGKL